MLTNKKGRAIPVCHEKQGESVAISSDGNGFYTISEAKEEEGHEVDIPTFYYLLSPGKLGICGANK